MCTCLRRLLPLFLAGSLLAAPPAFTREGKGPSLLLVHGFGGNRDVWKDLVPALARDHTVVRVDLPGSGGTAGPPLVEGAADLEAVARELAALVRREQLAPCLVVGHSMGGPLAALAVLQDPGAFRGLLLVDSFLGAIPSRYFDPIVARLDQDPEGALRAFFGPMAAGEPQRDRLAREALRVPAPILQAYLRGMTRDTLKGRQALLALPVVQFQAGPEETDASKRAAHLALYGFEGIPDFRVVPFPQARHWVMWDQPDAFLAALRAFEVRLRAPRQP